MYRHIPKLNQIYQGDCMNFMKTIPDECIDMVITSPPYWALRDYSSASDIIWGGDSNCEHKFTVRNLKLHSGRGDAEKSGKYSEQEHIRDTPYSDASCIKCGAWRGQLGLEPTFQEYINNLCDIFDEVKRILKRTGTCWVNIGDTYSTQSGSMGSRSFKVEPKQKSIGLFVNFKQPKTNLPTKCLCQIPSRFVVEMINRGWTNRNEIIWHKPNVKPSPAKDRFTVDFEKLYFFTKNRKYDFEQQFEPYDKPMNKWGGVKLEAKNHSNWDEGTGQVTYRKRSMRPNPKGRNRRCVWRINTKPFTEAHFATYPEELLGTPIKAGCPQQGVVFDPFIGSGTTAVVASRLGRKFLGCELNPDYVKIANQRILKEIDKL